MNPQQLEISESQDVQVTIANVRFPRGSKSLLGVVSVILSIGGVEITICGLSVIKKNGYIIIEPPTFRDSSGIKRSVLMVPDAINEVLADVVLSLFCEVENAPEQIH